MYRGPIVQDLITDGFPRTRGDVPSTEPCSGNASAFPPHTRGCTVVVVGRSDDHKVSPAHAGMYPIRRGDYQPVPGFPRTRGDVPGYMQARPFQVGFPPHTRGCTCRPATGREAEDVSPAHAGMYPVSADSLALIGSFPRTRGDVPPESPAAEGTGRFPPHTRGCTVAPQASASWSWALSE